ncbi:kinase-like domain-containing protein, partial [Pavlovales sp. CCMP2436]
KQSPSVVQLYFSFASKANVYMVMEYMPRGDCHALLQQLGFFEEDLASFYLAETVEALAYLHSLGIIMRDLKPQNMLIGADGHLKLTDFGLS